MRLDIVAGATLPDYQLPDHTRTPRKLSELQGTDNTMILMLGRGASCPKDRQRLAQLVEFSSQCGVGYTRIVTITCDEWVASSGLRLGVGAHWPFLHDPGRRIRDGWGRPSLADLHRDLREITTQVRFDADLAARDVRSAWERGERSRFYPYASSFEHAIAEMDISGGSWR